jgi:hypothetical protein
MNFKKQEKQFKRVINYLKPSSHRAFRKLLDERGISDQTMTANINHHVLISFSSEFWHDDMGRYAYLLVKHFRIAGYQIFFTPEFSFFSRLNKYKKLLQDEAFRFLEDSHLPADTLKIRDGRSERMIRVQKAKNANQLKESAVMAFPYMMHPYHYASSAYPGLPALRKNLRKGSLLFAGNAERKNYSGGRVAGHFGKVPRYELLAFLEAELKTEQIHYPRETQTSPEHKLLTVIRSSDFKIIAAEWLPTLSRYDFFLACPGSDMPMCHNVVEAMAVGCIPVLEYPEYFHPALEDGKNCIIFRGKTDLLRQLRRIEQRDAAEIAQLRKGVLSYYDRFLAPESWTKSLAESEKTVLLFDAWKLAE